jgi:hypothetical protein
MATERPAMLTPTTILTAIMTRPSPQPPMTSHLLNLVEAICPIFAITPLYSTTDCLPTIPYTNLKCADAAQCPPSLQCLLLPLDSNGT